MTSVPSGTDWATDTAHKHVMRAALILRDGPWCHYCGDTFSTRKGKRLTFDHVWPQTFGRVDSDWNIVLACADCNSRRGHSLDWCFCDFCQTAKVFGELAVLGVAA